MKYPNLAAEMYWLDDDIDRKWMIDAANITQEVFDAVMAGDDEFSLQEAVEIAKYLEKESDYLFSDKLEVVDMASEEHRNQVLLLEDKILQQKKTRTLGIWNYDKVGRARTLPKLIKSGEAVPLADLTGSTYYIDWMIRVATPEPRPPKRAGKLSDMALYSAEARA